MLGAKMRSDLKAHKGNVEMLQAVTQDPNSVGFSGLSYATSDVKAVPLGFSEQEGFVAIDSPEADRGRYPLVRRLQLVVNHNPEKELPALQQEFIKYVFSRLGPRRRRPKPDSKLSLHGLPMWHSMLLG